MTQSTKTTTKATTRTTGLPEVAADHPTLIGERDLHYFNEGTHARMYERLGAHRARVAGTEGCLFAVWAPSARQVSVVGDFNGWDPSAHPLSVRGSSGIWEDFVPGVERGALYKFHIASQHAGYVVDKADPYGFWHQTPPQTASVVWDLDYAWSDDQWMRERGAKNGLDAPMSIYEVHLGSWRRDPARPHEFLGYRELAHELADHVARLGFTHVQFLPVMEHPFYGSWGYQVTGYFAPSARQGTPQDFMYLVDVLHQRGVGVILDWVPAHFPSDEHGLGYFDGTHLYEHEDPRLGFHPDWNSLIYNYGRHEVRSFLLSSAIFWLDRYHVDGLRVDGVASMLYLDYSRDHGQWIPNQYGGRENLEAISFLRQFNQAVYAEHPDVQTIAEESTAWPMVSRPTYAGGLGFGLKWDMGWMHDTLRYMSRDPIHRKYHQNDLTFRGIYAFHENFVLPLSHDEVVYGKGSLIGKMPGDSWQKFANLRLLYGYMFGISGKKLLFMGGELAQWSEWQHDHGLDWALLGYESHKGVSRLLGELNRLYRQKSALHELDADPAGLSWIDAGDFENSVLCFSRKDRRGQEIVVVLNFTPQVLHNYRVGVNTMGFWREILNTDAEVFGGSGQGNMGGVESHPVPWHDRRFLINLTLPPLAALWLEGPEAD
jgi:1,4-alpha-glucan branching enzyme